MSDARAFERMTGLTAIIAGVLAITSLWIGLAGLDYQLDAFSGAEAILGAGAAAAPYIRWSQICNLLGNYLLLFPTALLLWRWLRPANPPFADFYTLAGLFFLSVGGIASGILVGAWPDMLIDYANAAGAERYIIATIFINFTRSIENGLQGLVQNLPGAIWLLGMGGMLKRERPTLGWLTLIFGSFMLVNSLGSLLDNSTLSMIGFSGNFLILPVWAVWIGLDLLRRPALTSRNINRQ
jgi:hypothetical protein